MPLTSCRLVQLAGRVCFLGGSIWSNKGSKISHSSSLRSLKYGMVAALDGCKHFNLTLARCQMGSIKPRAISLRSCVPEGIPNAFAFSSSASQSSSVLNWWQIILPDGKRISIEHAGGGHWIFRSNGIEKSPTFRGKSRFRGDRHLHGATAVKSLAGVGTRHGLVPIKMVDTADRDRPRWLKLKIVCRITDLRLKTEENIATPT